MNNNICMMINNIPTLEQSCITAVRKIVTAGDIHELIKKENFEKFVNLPEPLKNKIAAFPMFFKLGHEYKYKIPGSGPCDTIHLDEDNNHIYLRSKKHNKLTRFKMEEKEKTNSFKSKYFDIKKNGSFIYWGDSTKINFLKNGIDTKHIIPYENARPYKILNNQRTILFYNDENSRERYLFDLEMESLLIKDPVQQIQFDIHEKLCLTKDFNDIFTLYNTENPTNYQKIQTFNNLKDAVINPNGKQILISTQDNKCELISITGKKLFEIEDGTKVNSAFFNDTGDYIIIKCYNKKNELKYNIINTNTGITCFSLQLSLCPYSSQVCFYKKFLIVIDEKNNSVYLMRIKDFSKINNGLYTLDDIKKSNIIYKFETVSNIIMGSRDKSYLFHPSGKYIITMKNNLWKLIHIKSKECVATFENISHSQFSEPTGKMLYVKDKNEKWYKVFHCRNDFKLEDILLYRLITEDEENQAMRSKLAFSRNL